MTWIFLSGITSGALLVVLVAGLAVAWVCRGHRADLTALRLVNVREEKDRRDALGPYRPIEKEPPQPGPRLPPPDWSDFRVEGDSERPPANVQHGAGTREVDGGDR